MTLAIKEKQKVQNKTEGRRRKHDDRHFVSLALKGDNKAFSLLMERYRSKVKSLALKITKNETDAEDVVQETFLSVYTKLHTFQGKSAFSSWLYRVAANSALMRVRGRKRDRYELWEESLASTVFPMPGIFEVPKSWSSCGDQMLLRKELSLLLEKAFVKLPKRYRDLLALRDFDRVSNQEIAVITGMTVSAVKSRLHRARVLFRKALWELGVKGEDLSL